MKKISWKSLMWLTMCACALTFTACGDDDDNNSGGNPEQTTDAKTNLVGDWTLVACSESGAPVGGIFTFNSNGTGSYAANGESVAYTYTYTSDSKFSITMPRGAVSGTLAISGDVASGTYSNSGSSSQYTFTLQKVSGGGDDPTTSGKFAGRKSVFGNEQIKKFGNYSASGNGNVDEYCEFTYNSDGNVTDFKIYDNNVYEGHVGITYTGGITLTTYGTDGTPWRRITPTIGSNGYVSSYDFTDEKGHKESFQFTYNSDGQLLTYTENGDYSYTFTYSDGDIVRVSETDGGGDTSVWDIFYSTDTQAPILNVGGVMEYDHAMGIDMDDFGISYYLGMFGKGTKHLPLAYTKTDAYGTESVTNQWTLDSQNRPVKLVVTTTQSQYSSIPSTRISTFFFEW